MKKKDKIPFGKGIAEKLLDCIMLQTELERQRETEYLILFRHRPPKKEGILENITK